ncbi:MAG: hypothetical protein HKO75_04535 [Flavobacteriaceae bacterium]|nr:hypothetical protein [Muriicola sp.]NNC63104.1 hypothetical protein [Eudoraea sp.]NNK21597.1 hypothetical protein [Flavobacteriaceae bacterium]NNL39110.1 hypothetical protein [Flavobacteriaceae bacterium]
MRKWISLLCPLIMILMLASFGTTPKITVTVPEALIVREPTPVLYPKDKTNMPSSMVIPPFVGSSFVGFKEALAFKESQGDYFIINTLGYLGKYQFGIGTLQLMGVYNATKFLNDPTLQERVFRTNLARNKWILRRDIHRFVGKRVKGIEISESGILAAAHLAGPGNVKKFLRSYGQWDVQDAYGTSISNYLEQFSGYDVSVIIPQRNPQI